jgi:hypothetical protein
LVKIKGKNSNNIRKHTRKLCFLIKNKKKKKKKKKKQKQKKTAKNGSSRDFQGLWKLQMRKVGTTQN